MNRNNWMRFWLQRFNLHTKYFRNIYKHEFNLKCKYNLSGQIAKLLPLLLFVSTFCESKWQNSNGSKINGWKGKSFILSHSPTKLIFLRLRPHIRLLYFFRRDTIWTFCKWLNSRCSTAYFHFSLQRWVSNIFSRCALVFWLLLSFAFSAESFFILLRMAFISVS